ncbi:hypothetical protein R3P38DRAFT_3120652 [Favolaschia claudopus]|uniref:DUF6534 domain-containing protein n=1 Tax=Favolaschia claudopus TaxID=2862362 RepID=A0AAV9ZE98_9AGAR
MHLPSMLVSPRLTAMLPREVLEVNDIAEIVGPMFIGNILNWMLFGTLIMQLYTYYQNFPSDRLGLKFLVYIVFLMDTIQTVLLTHHGWWYTITIWGVPDRFEELVWSAQSIPFMAGLISATVQMFYAWRIWILTATDTEQKWMKGFSVLIVLVALTQGLSAMVASMICASEPVQETLIRMHPEFSTWLAGSLANDVVITVCMIWILMRAKSNLIYAPSETLLTKLINRIIQSGSATAVVAAIDLALFVKFPRKNYHYVPAYVLGKIYSNSFFLNLNLRRPQRGPGQYSDKILNSTSLGVESTELRVQNQRRGGIGSLAQTASTGTLRFATSTNSKGQSVTFDSDGKEEY